jgi:hypothetical protein
MKNHAIVMLIINAAPSPISSLLGIDTNLGTRDDEYTIDTAIIKLPITAINIKIGLLWRLNNDSENNKAI